MIPNDLLPRRAGSRPGLLVDAALVAALTALSATKLAVVAWDRSSVFRMHSRTLEGLAAGRDSLLLLLAAALLAAAVSLLPRRAAALPRLLILAALAAYLLILLANLVSVMKLGRPFDLFWLGYAAPENAAAMATYFAAAITRRILQGIAICLAAALLAGGLAYRAAPRTRWIMAGAAMMLAAAQGCAWFSRENPDAIAVRKVRGDPVVSFAFQAIVRHRLLLAGSGARVGDADWRLLPIRPGPLGRARPNVVLVTMDSATYALVTRALATAGGPMPTLAMLARAGRSYPAIYANYPQSAVSMMATLTSIYPEVGNLLSDAYSLRDRDVLTFPAALGRAGYRTGLFMSGELWNYGIGAFLGRHPLDTSIDNTTLRCPGDRRERLRLYDHLGDDCIATAASAWVATDRRRPFFAWLWFDGTHYPYFSRANALDPKIGDPKVRAWRSLADADAALTIMVDALRRTGRFDNTVFIVTADHGEAFGEHGMRMHGTSVFEEQVRVPLIISGAALAGLRYDPRPASLVDLGPSILQLAGVGHGPGMQGRSLFAPAEHRRVYFLTNAGGMTLGYRDGTTKYILDFTDDRVTAYDLAADPGELAPLAVSGAVDRAVRARLSGFMRYRWNLRWPALPGGPALDRSEIARSQKVEQGAGAF